MIRVVSEYMRQARLAMHEQYKTKLGNHLRVAMMCTQLIEMLVSRKTPYAHIDEYLNTIRDQWEADPSVQRWRKTMALHEVLDTLADKNGGR
jgi:hypothetical protein